MEPGELVEDWTLPDENGEPVTLSSFAGSPVVLFFYPRADTSGCTVEACGFRDQWAKLRGAGAVVLGISRDTVRAQKKWKTKHELNYPLLADPGEEICNRFGVMKEKTMYGKKVRGIERTTFLIGPDRTLLRVWNKVKPEGHAEEVLAGLTSTLPGEQR